MPSPTDILLPANAKYYAFSDVKLDYNPNWDINWSFEYALSATEAGFCTFLTTFQPTTGFPGHYLGFSGSAMLSSYLVTESGEFILTEGGERMTIESETGIENNGILAIAFDSTGLFALSTVTRGGVGLGSIRRNSLVIRNHSDDLIVNTQLSSMRSDFVLMSGGFAYQTLRFRYSQAGNKLSIDFKRSDQTEFTLLTSIVTRLVTPVGMGNVFTGFSYCSPISSATMSPGTFRIKNFHTQGNSYEANTEQTSFNPIPASSPSNFNQLTSLSSLI